MSRLPTIIVDDEPLAVAELKAMLKEHPAIEVIATAEEAEAAISLIEQMQPRLLFLDINMPGKDGFGLLEELSHLPQVIFVTAYDEYAIKAFEVNALDYLLKPINPQRLAEAINRSLKLQAASAAKEPPLNRDKRIFIKDGDKCYFVPLTEIYLIESAGNYSQVFFRDKKPLLHKSLTYLEERLPSSDFFRANRRHIINLNFVEDIHPYFNSTLMVTLRNGTRIEISQRQSIKFRELTGL